MTGFIGKTVVITGAASGIGAACVKRLYADGANIVAIDVQSERLEQLENEFEDCSRVHGVCLDVTDHYAVAAMMADLDQRFSNLYGLVNCAGVRGIGTLLNIEPEQWNHVIDVNLNSTFHTCQAFAKSLLNRGSSGAIVNISSTAGVRAVPNRLAYVAAKMGVSGITQAMALELGAANIRVNAIAPGIIRTPMVQASLKDPENIKRIHQAYPLGRIGEPEEIASAAAFLLSGDASFITGVILPVDGGNTAGKPSH